MASERIHNEYDATRIANAVDTLAENLAGYTPESPVTPTDAMKAKLPSQSTGDRIADAVESLAQNFNGSNTVVADTEVSPAENTHDIGTYLTYNGKEYVVLKYIDIDDPLDYESGDPNIEEVSLPDGTYIVTDDGDGEGGSGGGHTIIDASGTSMTARSGLKFGEGFNTADDSSNNQTVVTPDANVIAKQSEISDVILTGDKPSSAITEGKFFVDKNGLLRVATSSIGTTDDVDNTNSTVKSIGEVLGELNSNLSAHTIVAGSAINITDIATDDYYTCPSDGYLQLYTDAGATNVISVGIENGCGFTCGGTEFADLRSTFIRKGTRITVTGRNGTYTGATFFPLV